MSLRQRLKRGARAAIGERNWSRIKRATYAAGLYPRVNWAAANSIDYPVGRAGLVLSADLELAWGWQHARGMGDPLELARQSARQGRRNVGVVLDLCDRYDLPITWATVGHLFLDGCDGSAGRRHPEVPRVAHFENEYWAYQTGDWFDADPGSRQRTDPAWHDWYGPDLVRSVLDRPVAHEIGCHTFSHVVFSDEHCPPEVAAAELRQCQQLAGDMGLALRSAVFPGNLAGNVASLADAGFTAYRWHDGHELDVPRRDHLGLWRIPGGVCLDRPYASWSAAEHIQILRRYVDLAIDNGLVCGLWFHPEMDPGDVDAVFPAIFEHIAARRSELWVTTMGGMAGWLASREEARRSAVGTNAALNPIGGAASLA